MARPNKLAAAAFRDTSKPVIPEWKKIQGEDAARRLALSEKQKAARLAREAEAARTAEAEPAKAKPARRPKPA